MWIAVSSELTEAETNVGMLLGFGFLAVLAFIIFIGIRSSKKAKRARQRILSERAERGILESSNAHHLEGLPIGEKTKCELTLYNDRLAIDGGGTTFNITLPQFLAAEIKTDVEIAHQVHSSAAKGIAGGLLFGPIGAIIGSRATSKEVRKIEHYLVLNFKNSSGDIAAIVFLDDLMPWQTNHLVNRIQPLIQRNERHTVQL